MRHGLPSLALLIADRVAKKRGIGGGKSAPEGSDEEEAGESADEESAAGDDGEKSAKEYAADLRRAIDQGNDEGIVAAIRGIKG